MLRIGEQFYDEKNGRYITVDGVGADPKCYHCTIEEIGEDGDLHVMGLQNFHEGELIKMIRREI